MNKEIILWYVADPMCSWCWGFSPIISKIKEKYKDKLKISLLLGGLRPGPSAPISDESRNEIFHHWHDVHKRSKQPFDFDGALPDGFVYDTELPSRAVIAVSEIKPEVTFEFFHNLQEAFYANQQDITNIDILTGLAKKLDVNSEKFLEKYADETVKEKTKAHFMRARQAGVTGFPTCVLQLESEHKLLSSGYMELVELEKEIDSWVTY